MMTVGNQLESGQVSQLITNYTVAMRNLCQAIANLNMNVNGQAEGLATLEAAGYDSADAQTALSAIGYLNTVSQVWFGGAAQTPAFNFNNELSPYFGGQ
jgi:hypothetical protein